MAKIKIVNGGGNKTILIYVIVDKRTVQKAGSSPQPNWLKVKQVSSSSEGWGNHLRLLQFCKFPTSGDQLFSGEDHVNESFVNVHLKNLDQNHKRRNGHTLYKNDRCIKIKIKDSSYVYWWKFDTNIAIIQAKQVNDGKTTRNGKSEILFNYKFASRPSRNNVNFRFVWVV